jgi:hypothetical protein
MLFHNLYNLCGSDGQYVQRQLELGLDACVHVGHLNPASHKYGMFHPDVKVREWIEEREGLRYFCLRLDTPAGPLTGRVRQRDGWPREGEFSLLNDFVVPRAEEPLVKPERDLEKARYLFGPFKDADIEALREEASRAKAIADERGLLLTGGWKGSLGPRLYVDPGVMGCDAMAWLSGFEEVMALSITAPEVIREYANIIHEWNMKQIEVYLEVTGAELIIRRGWYETTEFWTPGAYRDIVAPTLGREAELVHQAGRKYGYIITSAFLPVLEDILDAGVDVLIGLDPEEGKGTDLEAVKKMCMKKGAAIWGGVSGAATVERGTAESTEAAVHRALELLGQGGGFILSPVDNVREDTGRAWANTRVFIDTWKRSRA